MRPRALGVAVIVLLFAGLAYLEFSPRARPNPPPLPNVSSCAELGPGMRRIGEQMGFQDVGFRFDVPTKDFTIHEGCTDASPLICGFDIRPKSSTAWLSISWGEETTERKPPDPILDSSENVEKRRILDDQRRLIGEESWGYWGQGERWRRVHLLGWIQARYGSKNATDVPGYGSVRERDAALFDQIINSACRISPSERRAVSGSLK